MTALVGTCCVVIMNLYLGRLVAIADVPSAVVGTRSWRVAATFLGVGSVGLLLLFGTNGLRLSSEQGMVLTGAFLSAYWFHRSLHGDGQPPVPWDVYLNQRLHAVTSICRRHGWDVTSERAALELAGRLHFDGRDFDTLLQAEGEEVGRLRQGARQDVRIGADTDYDRVTALEIVTLSGAFAGSDAFEGIVREVGREYDLSGLDREAFMQLQWLAGALRRQWGEAALYAGPGG